MHKIGFLGHPIGASWAIGALYLNVLTQSFSEITSVLPVNSEFAFLSHPLGRLRDNVGDSSSARWKTKLVVDFL